MSFINQIISNLNTNKQESVLFEVREKNMLRYSKENLSLMMGSFQNHFQQRFQKGDRICIIGPNGAQWVALDLAILSMGCVTVPLYNRQDPKELAHIIDDVDPVLVVYFDPALFSEIEKHTTNKIQSKSVQSLLQNTNQPLPCKKINPHDTATIIYTSGTSGVPKGVVLTHQNITFMLTQTLSRLNLTKKTPGQKSRVFHFLPLCFAGSRITLLTHLFSGTPTYFSTDLKNLVQEIQRVDPHYYLNVPYVLEKIKKGVENKINTEKPAWVGKFYQATKRAYQKICTGKASLTHYCIFFVGRFILLKSIKRKIGPSLEFLVCGSAALSADTQRWFEMLNIPVYQVYGLTETTAIVTMDIPQKVQAGYVGFAIDNIEMKLSNEGELLTKGDHIFKEYFRMPDQTKNVLKDGWFATGDLCEITADGRLKVVGRIKDVIIPTSGHNIVPEPLEQQLTTLNPSIEQACLIGHGKSKLGVIVTGQLSNEMMDQTLDEFNCDQPHYKKIAYYIHAHEPFSQENGLLTANQKLKRNEIESFFKPHIDERLREYA